MNLMTKETRTYAHMRVHRDPNFLDMRAALTAFLFGCGRVRTFCCYVCNRQTGQSATGKERFGSSYPATCSGTQQLYALKAWVWTQCSHCNSSFSCKQVQQAEAEEEWEKLQQAQGVSSYAIYPTPIEGETRAGVIQAVMLSQQTYLQLVLNGILPWQPPDRSVTCPPHVICR